MSTTMDPFYASIVLMTPSSDPIQNLAISSDLEFSTTGRRNHVQIGPRVYSTYSNSSLPPKSIGMSQLLMEDFFSALAENANASRTPSLYQCRLYPLEGHSPPKARCLQISLSKDKHAKVPNDPLYYTALDIAKAFMTSYRKSFLCEGQRVAFLWEDILLKGEIKKIETDQQAGEKRYNFAFVDDECKTEIDAEAPLTSLPLLDAPATFKNPIVECFVTVKKGENKLLSERGLLFPYGVTIKNLTDGLRSKFNKSPLYLTTFSSCKVAYPLILQMTIGSFSNPENGQSFKLPDNFTKPIPCLPFTDELQFHYILEHKTLSLVEAKESKAAKLRLKITDLQCHRLKEEDLRPPCFFLDEMKEALSKQNASLFKGSRGILRINDKAGETHTLTYVIEDGIGKKASLIPRSQNALPRWIVTPQTELIVDCPSDLAVIAANSHMTPAKKVLFSMNAESPPHEGKGIKVPEESLDNEESQEATTNELLEASEAELINAIRKNLKHVVKGESFIFKDSNLKCYALTVKKISWYEPLAPGQRDNAAIAHLDERTKIALLPSPHIKLIRPPRSNPGDIKSIFMELKTGALTETMVEALKSLDTFHTHRKEVKALGIAPARGILLFGKPGTGKSKMAVAIAKFLGIADHRCRIIDTPSMLNKFVGSTEKKIRSLFEPAKKAYDALGENSPFFAIILDEIASLFFKRSSDNKGWENSQIEQLLACIDGPESMPPNLIIIGTTNRIDDIDEAIKRPGRLGIQIEVSLPNAIGREEIFLIHTAKGRRRGMIAKDVNWRALAAMSEGYTGAMIHQVVMNTHLQWIHSAGAKDGQLLGQRDYERAIANYKVPSDSSVMPQYIRDSVYM